MNTAESNEPTISKFSTSLNNKGQFTQEELSDAYEAMQALKHLGLDKVADPRERARRANEALNAKQADCRHELGHIQSEYKAMEFQLNSLVTRESDKYAELFSYDDAMDRLRTVHLELAKPNSPPLSQLLASVRSLSTEVSVV